MRSPVWRVLLVASLSAIPRAAHANGSVEDGLASRASLEQASRSSDADMAAAAFYRLGAMDDDAFDFAGAVAHYGASVALRPSSRDASRATARGVYLASHAEGDFGPLVRLERLRRDPALSNDATSIDALARDADGFPPGPVRVEARLLAAEAYRGRVHRPDAEAPILWKVVRDPSADSLSSREAAAEIVDVEIALGDLDAAARAVRELEGTIDARVAVKVTRLVRRRAAHAAALAEMAVFFGLLAVALVRGRAVGAFAGAWRILPLATAFSLFVAGGGGLLAASYEAGSAAPFLLLGPPMLGVILLSRAWSAVGSRSAAARITRGALAASSLFAATFLLLERWTPQVLDGFGL